MPQGQRNCEVNFSLLSNGKHNVAIFVSPPLAELWVGVIGKGRNGRQGGSTEAPRRFPKPYLWPVNRECPGCEAQSRVLRTRV